MKIFFYLHPLITPCASIQVTSNLFDVGRSISISPKFKNEQVMQRINTI